MSFKKYSKPLLQRLLATFRQTWHFVPLIFKPTFPPTQGSFTNQFITKVGRWSQIVFILVKQIRYQKGYCKKEGYLEKDNISYDIDAHLPHNLLKLISAVT